MDHIKNLSYQEMKDRIRRELNQVTESFVEIGYRLKQIKDGELYKADGYSNIHEFAQKEYNLSQSSTSRFMAINSCFSINGNSPKLLPDYEGYGFSKLSEMLTLSEEEMKLISIRTTRVEIREIKQVKKEAEGLENDENYAPAHNQQSLENTQSNTDFETRIPDAKSILIEFFRERSRREILKQLAALLRDGTSKGSIKEVAAVIINPSGHLMFKKSLVVMMFEEDHIKYNRIMQPVQQFTYIDFLSDTALVFDMAAEDPWVEFYGEPEPEVIPEVKTEVKVIPKHEEKPKEKPKLTKQEKSKTVPPVKASPQATVSEDHKVRSCRVCGCTDDHACESGCYWVEPDLCSACVDKVLKAAEPEIVEADIVNSQDAAAEYDINVKYDEATGEVEVYLDGRNGIKMIRVIDTGTGESWEVTINQ